MLHPKSTEIIQSINDGDGDGSLYKDRYKNIVIHAVQGTPAFNLHTHMVPLDESWPNSFSDTYKQYSLLLAVVQTTISKAKVLPKVPRRRLFLYFYNTTLSDPVRTSLAYSHPKAKKWLRLFQGSGITESA